MLLKIDLLKLKLNQVNQIKLPEWFGKEISTLVTNSDMAINPSKTIFNILQE